jgi:hypothetical protein
MRMPFAKSEKPPPSRRWPGTLCAAPEIQSREDLARYYDSPLAVDDNIRTMLQRLHSTAYGHHCGDAVLPCHDGRV